MSAADTPLGELWSGAEGPAWSTYTVQVVRPGLQALEDKYVYEGTAPANGDLIEVRHVTAGAHKFPVRVTGVYGELIMTRPHDAG